MMVGSKIPSRKELKYKLISSFLLFAILIFLQLPSHAEEDLAHEIWKAMGEAGKKDMSQAWEFMGVYSFGETTTDGEVTLFLTDDNSKISKSVSWRNYPDDDSEITDQFFPMLKCLLMNLDRNESEETVDSWIEQVLPTVLLARQNNLSFKSAEKLLQGMTVFVQFDSKHKELYSLIVCTKTNDWFSE